MTPAQGAMLLTVAASFDRRKPDEIAAQAWAVALNDWPFEDCRDAIVEHYGITREWLMPSDVIRIVKNKRWSRIQALGYVQPPRELRDHPEREGDWLRALNSAAGDGLTKAEAIQAANQTLGIDPQPEELTHKVSDVLKAIETTKRDRKARPRDAAPKSPTPPTTARREDER